MRLFNRTILSPITIRRTHTGYFDPPDIAIRFNRTKMTGTMKTTSYTLDIQTPKIKFQVSLCWRPDVTRHWYNKSKECGYYHN